MADDTQNEQTSGSADAGADASMNPPVQVDTLRRGGFVCLKNRPCKLMAISISKTGKHGHAKASLTGMDLFTGKSYEETHPTSHSVGVPDVQHTQYQLLNITDDGFVSLMSANGNLRDDMMVPEGDVRDEIVKLFRTEKKDTVVVVLSAMGEEQVIEASGASKAA